MWVLHLSQFPIDSFILKKTGFDGFGMSNLSFIVCYYQIFKLNIMLKRINYYVLTALVLTTALIIQSCTSDSVDIDSDESNVSVEERFMDFFNNQTGDYPEVEFDQSLEFNELMSNLGVDMKTGSTVCATTPNCPKETITGVHFVNATCSYDYSYTIYDCGNDNYAIFDFQMAPTSTSNCFFYDSLVTQNYVDGDLTQYQLFSNRFAVTVLSDIEDAEYAAGTNNTGQTLIAVYIPNICAVECQANGAQEECGEDCCIRFAIYNNATGERSTTAFSSGECGGQIATCSDGITMDECKNFQCPELNLYR